MQIVKMFAALLMAAGVMQALATQARAEVSPGHGSSIHAEMGCGWKHPYNYHYRYHFRTSLRRPSPFQHPRAPRPRRKVDPND